MDFIIQLVIVLICLFYGARKGGIALGLLGGIGLVILVFIFKLQPGKPPVDVMLVIICRGGRIGNASGIGRAGCDAANRGTYAAA
nr:anaerobic C4-dicarboxylate transporter family protein [Pectobacterium colocasium]